MFKKYDDTSEIEIPFNLISSSKGRDDDDESIESVYENPNFVHSLNDDPHQENRNSRHHKTQQRSNESPDYDPPYFSNFAAR